MNNFDSRLALLLDELEKFLKIKNKKYGNSALEPVNIFNKAKATNTILTRLDDKLSRIKNNEELQKNDVVDLTGYLLLLMIDNDWNNFDEFID